MTSSTEPAVPGTSGILDAAAYVPRQRLDRSTIAAVAGKGGGQGTRSVASYDEDATTMAVAAASAVMVDRFPPESLWFTTTAPPYVDRTNASTIHAALQLDASVAAFDATGSVRSTGAALWAARHAPRPTLVVAADVRTGLPGSVDESVGGDGAAALLWGGATSGPLLAELIGSATSTEEFMDRWRTPGERASKEWESRFGESRYERLARSTLSAGLANAGLEPSQLSALAVAGPHERAVRSASRLGPDRGSKDLRSMIGETGAAHPLLGVVQLLEASEPGDIIALLILADGADVMVLRVTDHRASWTPTTTLGSQIAADRPISYGTFLRWRNELCVEPPRRPEPARTSASAAARNAAWKLGLEGFAGHKGKITACTVDRLAYSPSPPVVFAVVDFDNGRRLPMEIADAAPDEVHVGDYVEPTFRRLFSADGLHNYFWKARLVHPPASKVPS